MSGFLISTFQFSMAEAGSNDIMLDGDFPHLSRGTQWRRVRENYEIETKYK